MPAPVLTERQRLATVALAAAQSVDGVVAGNPGRARTFVTIAGPARLPGVLANPRDDGRIDLSLQLTTQVVPLHPLADAVRAAVHRAAGADLLADRVGMVHVRIADVVHPMLGVSAR